MALFFTLSGFLIVTTLTRNPSVPSFLIRRFCRIMPLVILATLVYLPLQQKSIEYFPSHLLLFTNFDFSHQTNFTSHYWSLCVEAHFYLTVAALAACFGLRGLTLLPVLMFAVTFMRVRGGHVAAIWTHHRVDEILVGASLAAIRQGDFGKAGRIVHRMIRALPSACWLALFLLSCHSVSHELQYARGYLAAALVGSTLIDRGRLNSILASRTLRYIAEISFALYIIHPLSHFGRLGSGGPVEKYSKRILCFAISFGLAHLSTYYFERHWIHLGKRWARRFDRVPPVAKAWTRPETRLIV